MSKLVEGSSFPWRKQGLRGQQGLPLRLRNQPLEMGPRFAFSRRLHRDPHGLVASVLCHIGARHRFSEFPLFVVLRRSEYDGVLLLKMRCQQYLFAAEVVIIQQAEQFVYLLVAYSISGFLSRLSVWLL